jgi:hypothetical protein
MLAVFPRHDGARQARTGKRRRNGRATTMQHVPLHPLPQAVKAPVFVGASVYFFLLCEIPLTFAYHSFLPKFCLVSGRKSGFGLFTDPSRLDYFLICHATLSSTNLLFSAPCY